MKFRSTALLILLVAFCSIGNANYTRVDITLTDSGYSRYPGTVYNRFVDGTDLVNVVTVPNFGSVNPKIAVLQYTTKNNKLAHLKTKYFEPSNYYYSGIDKSVAVSGNGKRMAYRNNQGCFKFVDLISLEENPSCLRGEWAGYETLKFDFTGRHLSIWSKDFVDHKYHGFMTWDLEENSSTRLVQLAGYFYNSGAVLQSVDVTGKKAFFLERFPFKETRQLSFRDTETGNLIFKIDLTSELIALDAQNEIAAYGADVDGFTYEIKLWDLKLNRERPLKKKIISKAYPEDIFYPWIVTGVTSGWSSAEIINIETGFRQTIEASEYMTLSGFPSFDSKREKFVMLTSKSPDSAPHPGNDNMKTHLELWRANP